MFTDDELAARGIQRERFYDIVGTDGRGREVMIVCAIRGWESADEVADYYRRSKHYSNVRKVLRITDPPIIQMAL